MLKLPCRYWDNQRYARYKVSWGVGAETAEFPACRWQNQCELKFPMGCLFSRWVMKRIIMADPSKKSCSPLRGNTWFQGLQSRFESSFFFYFGPANVRKIAHTYLSEFFGYFSRPFFGLVSPGIQPPPPKKEKQQTSRPKMVGIPLTPDVETVVFHATFC